MTLLKTTITLTRYSEPNWLLLETLNALSAQVGVSAKVLVLDQKSDKLIEKACNNLSTENLEFVYQVIPAKSLSYARNVALSLCTTDVLLYIDTDALASNSWALELTKSLMKPNVALAGGKIIPLWHKKPSFIQKSNAVLDQYSMLDLGDLEIETHRVVGASFGINKSILKQNATFDEQLGRRHGKLYSGEESDLCKRASIRGFKIIYNGASVVKHQVLPERMAFKWIASRMYYQGMASAQRGGGPRPSNKGMLQSADYKALAALSPFYLIGYVKGFFGKGRSQTLNITS